MYKIMNQVNCCTICLHMFANLQMKLGQSTRETVGLKQVSGHKMFTPYIPGKQVFRLS